MQWRLRPYGYFFIRQLLKRIPETLVAAPEILAAKRKLPRTLREFDDRVTAPLGGFASALEYYEWAAAKNFVHAITVPTLVLASDDDRSCLLHRCNRCVRPSRSMFAWSAREEVATLFSRSRSTAILDGRIIAVLVYAQTHTGGGCISSATGLQHPFARSLQNG